MDPTAPRCRVLFVAEAVTLAHVARANVLARTLDPSQFDVHAAWDARYNALLGPLPFTHHAIHSLPTATFLKRLSRGEPMHDSATLRGYVRDELEIISRLSPDVIVGDFRVSLAVSARKAGVPYVAIANAYWSPYGGQTFDFPEYDYPLGSVVGRSLSRRLFQAIKTVGFGMHTRPLNMVRREHGLAPLEGDIRHMYTEGDITAYADIPSLVPLENLPPTHRYIGAVLWSPAIPDPDWWADLPPDRPVIYVTLGSSGEAEALPRVVEAVSELPVSVIAATAGRLRTETSRRNVYVADFLDGVRAAGRSSLVVCNGGSPTTYQALAAGVPVLGLTSNNMDQHLNMEAVGRAGAGAVLQARRATLPQLRGLVMRLIDEEGFRRSAAAMSDAHWKADVRRIFPTLVGSIRERTGPVESK